MKDLSTVDYHPTSQKLVDILCKKTQSDNPLFFHVLSGYYLSKITSMMRVNIATHDRGSLPINMYAINLGPSGLGKGYSTNIIEEQVINKFRERFLEETFPMMAEIKLAKLAAKRAARSGEDVAVVEERVKREFELLGTLAFSFDSGTPAAVKQMRQKLLMADAGSMNMEIDEIGSNLLGNVDVLNVFLELFDVGKVKQKLTKNTAESIRSEEIEGKTPTNMLLFGTPNKLFDGGRVESEIMSFFETGFARRCVFGIGYVDAKEESELTPEQIYDMLTDTSSGVFLSTLSDDFTDLADPINFGKELKMSKDVSLLLIKYKLQCEKAAKALPEHDEIKKAEVSHRYFKALKLAGTYSFVDGEDEVTEDNLYAAIKLIEESGKAFEKILTRERNYVKLAKYITQSGKDLTHADLVEDLPFFKGSIAHKTDLLTLATAWGHKNHRIIRKSYVNGIEFLSGESLKETDLDNMIVSYSKHVAYNYLNETIPFSEFHVVAQASDMHWANHHMDKGHRSDESTIQGFNMVVLDVDEGVSLETAKLLLQEYKCMFYTTKRHTETHNRFRIVMPLSHTLKMDKEEFKKFMDNIYEFLPFDVDTGTNQPSKKWRSFPTEYYYNEGKLLDALDFIPETAKSEERKQAIVDTQSLTNLERWFANNTATGNRSNQLIKYALLLVDSGQDIISVQNNVLALNDKLPDKMDHTEILSTIMVSVNKAITKREDT